MPHLVFAVVLIGTVIGCTTPASTPAPTLPAPPMEITLEKVKAADLPELIAKHKGKVVAVDVWADFCAPCKKAFPHLVQLHRQHAADGLVCISLSKDLDDGYDGALAFLKSQKAHFNNYIVWDSDEALDALEKKIPHTAIPIFHVFDRDGKRVKTWEGAIRHDEIDATIGELLKKK